MSPLVPACQTELYNPFMTPKISPGGVRSCYRLLQVNHRRLSPSVNDERCTTARLGGHEPANVLSNAYFVSRFRLQDVSGFLRRHTGQRRPPTSVPITKLSKFIVSTCRSSLKTCIKRTASGRMTGLNFGASSAITNRLARTTTAMLIHMKRDMEIYPF